MTDDDRTQKPKVPKVDAKFVAKQYAIGYGSHWLTNVILGVPIVILWLILYLVMIRSGWILTLSANTRGILIIAVLAVPLIAAAFVRGKVRDWLAEKWTK